MDITEAAAAHARATYEAGDFPHITEVAAYGRQLAALTGADQEIVMIAAYFHDISRASSGPEGHNVKSAEMARQWLSRRGYPLERLERVATAIVAHMLPAPDTGREAVPLEGQILYDADKLSRAQGVALLGALVHLGTKVSWEQASYAELAEAMRQARRVTRETFGSLYTAAARELAEPGYRRAIAFFDGLLEMPILRPESRQGPEDAQVAGQ